MLDPIDKIYRSWKAPTDSRLCGMITHSDAQAALYRAHGARVTWTVADHGLPGCEIEDDGIDGTLMGTSTAAEAEASRRRVYERRTVVVMGGAKPKKSSSSKLKSCCARLCPCFGGGADKAPAPAPAPAAGADKSGSDDYNPMSAA